MDDSHSIEGRELPREFRELHLPKLDARLASLLQLSNAALADRYTAERKSASRIPRRLSAGAIDRLRRPDGPDPLRYSRAKARPARVVTPSTTGLAFDRSLGLGMRVLFQGQLPDGFDARRVKVTAGDLRLLHLMPDDVIDLAGRGTTDRLELVRAVSPAILDAREEIGLTRAVGKDLGPGDGPTGKGVIIGIVDFGLDFYHSQLRDQDGRTRVRGLWDVRSGKEYTQADIDADIASGTPYSVVDHRWHRQGGASAENAGAMWMQHGTNMACIAAGGPHRLLREPDNQKTGKEGPWGSGVAPEADILFVSLDPLVDVAGRDDLWGAAGFDQVLLAMQWILDKAKELAGDGPDIPVVINLSLADYTGPHDGTSLHGAFLDQLRSAPGRTVVAAAGNSADTGGHVSFQAGDAQRLRFDKWADADDAIELWAETSDGGVRFRVTAEAEPGAPQAVIECGIGDQTVVPLRDAAGADVAMLLATCKRAGDSVGFRVDVQMAENRGIARGAVWTVDVSKQSKASVHGWLEASNAGLREWASASDDVTISDLSSHPAFLTVGGVRNSYKDAHMPILRRSGVGPTRDKRPKPDIVAPAATVKVVQPEDQAAVSALSEREYSVGLASGTSVASAITAGACAVVMQCRGDADGAALFSAGDLRVLLQDTANKDKLDGVDKAVPPGLALSPKSGHGVLDVRHACDGDESARDLWIQTSPRDDGRTPRATAVFWDSPDIQAVWDDEGATVKVRVQNRGERKVARARVRLAWATPISWLNVAGFSAIRSALPSLFEYFFAPLDRFLDEPPSWAIDGIDAGGMGVDLGVVRAVDDDHPDTATFRFTPPAGRDLGPHNVQWLALVQGGAERVPREPGAAATRFYNELAIQAVLPVERASGDPLTLYGAVHALGPSNAVSLRTSGGVHLDRIVLPAAALPIAFGHDTRRRRYRVVSAALADDPLYQQVKAADAAGSPLDGASIGIPDVERIVAGDPGIVALHLKPGVGKLDLGVLRLVTGSRLYIQVEGQGGGADSRIDLIHLSSGDIIGGFSVRQAGSGRR